MTESHRVITRAIAKHHLKEGDALGWFEDLYATANGDASLISWADLVPNPNLMDWLDQHRLPTDGKKALKVGCGLGDDAEELARRGFDTIAFDISTTAIAWCERRFIKGPVKYLVEDLFEAPQSWRKGFDFVLESYTLQVLTPALREKAAAEIAGFVRPGGILLVISRGREIADPEGDMPWPLAKEELDLFKLHGLEETAFEDYMDTEDPPVRRFRVTYERRR